jgi:hypothetical protein
MCAKIKGMKPRTHGFSLAALWAVALLCGCGGGGGNNSPASNSAAENEDRGGVDIKVGNVHIQAGEPAGGKLPANFATDVPIYAGAVVKASVFDGEGDKAMGFATMHVPTTVEKVGEFYKAELKSQGWTEKQYVVSENQGKSGIMIGASKDTRHLAVVISTDKEDQTLVHLQLQLGKK